ncbi:MAG: hypothetical protein HXY34_03600 [Candidatus Thorarchaeota archaeon]|nr:hypothetical protein [Candidatus Thorarchaeota archaeon]
MNETRTLDRPIYKIADILGRRAQTIYGRQTVIDLCSKAGVSLMDDYDDDIRDVDSDEALMDFVTRYARMSPAARLTVLTLAKQYGVTLPEELTKKRKHSLKEIVEMLVQYLPRQP